MVIQIDEYISVFKGNFSNAYRVNIRMNNSFVKSVAIKWLI